MKLQDWLRHRADFGNPRCILDRACAATALDFGDGFDDAKEEDLIAWADGRLPPQEAEILRESWRDEKAKGAKRAIF